MRSRETTLHWEEVGAAVERLFGLHLRGERLPDLKRALKGAANELGLPDVEACARRMLSGELDAAGMEVLASHLTIGETYFFRDEDAFAALSTRILPALIDKRRRAGNRKLRIWSAACCTGEETYSLGILLRRLLPDIADWRVTLLGTDVNPRFLRKAEEGVYGEWSFRGTSPEFRARHFHRLAGGRHALSPAIRRMATFTQLNLAADADLASVRNGAFDLILCRNVLMYFTPAQAAKVVRELHRALHDDGWLAVAPCEASQTLFARFQPAHDDGAMFYRKGGLKTGRTAGKGASTRPAVPLARDRPRPAKSHAAHVAPPRAPEHAPSVATSKSMVPLAWPPETIPSIEAIAARAQALADQRRMGEALACCDRWIAAGKLDPEAHYLRGMILAEMGDMSEACAALERSLYLAPGGVMASLALANLERNRGRGGQAVRHYRHILALLERLPPEAGIEHAEGVTAQQLTTLVQDMMAVGEHT